MPISYDPNNANRAVELTEALNVIPNQWGLINQLGLFTNYYKTQKNILIPRYTEGDVLLEDRNWDERDSTIISGSRDELAVKVPHFPVKDAITPNDIDGVVNWNDIRNGVDLETVASVRARKMNTIRRALANTLEYARVHMIVTGDVYAPNRTLRTSYGNTINWYTEFGIAQKPVVTVDFSDEDENPLMKLQEAADKSQDGFKLGETVSSFIGLASPKFFDALVSNPYVVDAVKYINFPGISKNVLLDGAGNGGLDARYRVIDFAGVTWIRYTGGVGGTAFIPDDKAFVFPRAEGLFRTYFAPRNTFQDVNSVAKEAYWEEVIDVRGTKIEIEAESNFINFMSQPESVVEVENTSL